MVAAPPAAAPLAACSPVIAAAVLQSPDLSVCTPQCAVLMIWPVLRETFLGYFCVANCCVCSVRVSCGWAGSAPGKVSQDDIIML